MEQVREEVFEALGRGEAVAIPTSDYGRNDPILVCDDEGNEIEATVVAVSVVSGKDHAVVAKGRIDNDDNTN